MPAGPLRRLGVLLVALVSTGCARDAPPLTSPRDTVVWLSVDGLRGDYVTREAMPFLSGLAGQSPHTHALLPAFPPLTFASHATAATGVPAAGHGIVANRFRDTALARTFDRPQDGTVYEAEPIWLTASRQGVRVAVHDWPASQNQPGPVRAAHFLSSFDSKLSDDARLDLLLATWRDERGGEPLRLIMGYVGAVDDAGHDRGPDSAEVKSTLASTDRVLERFWTRAQQVFRAGQGSAGGSLYLVLTTDHGMATVRTMVNLEHILAPLPAAAEVVTSGTIANLYLDRLPAAEREELTGAVLARCARFASLLRAYRRADVPASWHYVHPRRTGDVVLVLEPGHAWGKRLPEPSYPLDDTDAPRGAHGYPVESSPDMRGFALFARFPEPLGARDLGEISTLRLHATVARLLGIRPADRALDQPIDVLAASPREAPR